VNLLLLDATDTDGLTQVLPAGRLREPMSAAERATAVVVTRAERATQVEAVMTRLRSAIRRLPVTAQAVFTPMEIVSVTTDAARAREWCRGKSALLVSGLGHPASFRVTAEELGLTVLDVVLYPDHHRYTLHDINRLRKRAAELKAEVLLTTEKDAGKIQPYLTQHDDERWWAVRLSVDWRAGEADLRKMIIEVQPSVVRRAGA
jgi:tetraacyldisaccharide 4'-kinase